MEENKNKDQVFDKKITRKQAIQKAGITALTAASLLFLDTKKASAGSKTPTPTGTGRGANVNRTGTGDDSDKTNNGNHNGHGKK